MSELEEIRVALNLRQAAFGKLLGGGQSTYQRWEAQPDSPASRMALDRAKVIYLEKMGRDWVRPAPPLSKADIEALVKKIDDVHTDVRNLISAVHVALGHVAKPGQRLTGS